MKNFFLLASVAMITEKMFFTHFHFQGNILLHQMQPITRNHNWENGVKHIKITEENLSQSCTLCQLLGTMILASGSKCIKHFFYHYLLYICWVEVIYLTCHAFLLNLLSLNILCINPFNLKNKIMKI